MTDIELATEIIVRLNDMIKNQDIRADIALLLETRVKASLATQDHPTIICRDGDVGLLGILNGIVGLVPGKICGLIGAVVDENSVYDLQGFRLMTEPGTAKHDHV
jgi:hypothetical protein